MTAFMLKRFPDRVEILSDGAEYTPAGVIVGMTCKVRLSDAVPFAIVGSGAVSTIEIISSVIMDIADRTGSVDATLAILADSLAEVGEAATYDTPVRIAIGAYSERRGPTTVYFDTFAEEGAQHTPFELVEAARWFGQGRMPDYSVLAAAGVNNDSSLAEHGVLFFDQMRRHKMASPARPRADPIYSVGGHLDFTVITAECCATTRIHTWHEDKIGEKIDPHRQNAAAIIDRHVSG